jgi:hypothetical protein
MALIILYTVFVQLRLSSPSNQLTLQLEAVKSGLVTALWLWLFIGGISGIGLERIIVALVALIVPM